MESILRLFVPNMLAAVDNFRQVKHPLRSARLRGLAVPTGYALFGVVWILASDLFLESLRLSMTWTTRIAVAKGWIFVAGSTALIFALMRRAWMALEKAFADLREELERRRLAQEESARWAVELEQRVQDRTLHLESALAELGMFTDSVSHDLRAPLRAINGFSQILLDDHSESLPEDARGLLRRSTDAAVRMDRMIEGLLDLSRYQRGNLILSDLAAAGHESLVDALWSEVTTLHPGRVFDFRRGALVGLRCDTRLLETLWRNLLGNAAKYTRGKVPALIQVEFQDGWFSVQDNGAGFPSPEIGEIFRPFRRLHRADEFEGDGIGLALVKRIIDRHGGEIVASGLPGLGATFRFRFPG